HDVVAALAGDEQALAAVRLRLPEAVDDPDPEHEHLVLDADSSQQAVIEAVRAGAHLVIKGPPGTGKSQTIANLVCTLAAEGKSVLFVAEKRAAIDAVLQRLDRLGLGDLVLDAYDGPTNRRATAQQFLRTLTNALDLDLETSDETITTLRERRARLQRHVEALHGSRDPWGVSAHEVQQALVELGTRRPAPLSHVRLASADLGRLSRIRITELSRRLRDVVGLGAWTRTDEDPWFGARILTQEDAVRALDITSRRSTGALDGLGAQLNEILAESQVPQANSADDWSSAFNTMTAVKQTLEVFRPEVFDTPLDDHIAATGSRDWRQTRDINLGWLDRWRIRRHTKRLLRPGRPPANLHAELVTASEQRRSWFALVGGGGRPEISPRLDEGTAVLSGLEEDLAWLDARLRPGPDGLRLAALPLPDLRARLSDLAGRPERISVLPQVTSVLDELRAVGLGDLVDDLARRGMRTEQVIPEVEHVWWASLAKEITVRDPAYGAHDGPGLRRDVLEFAEADRAHLTATVERVRTAVARNIREVLADHPAQEALVRAEGGKSRRHKAIRDLMPQASAALTAIKPCWAMSPLVVASTLPPGRWFDVVIFDEASQVQPAQAISAISRARQVVVAGDEKQLPPTNFFTVVSDDADVPATTSDDTLTEGFESVLDVLSAALPTRDLTWHYRSRDERLIAFANAQLYDGRLTTFPGTAIDSAVVFEPVDGQAEVQAGVDTIETTDGEVDRVVELVLEHARTRPTESLGVIALGSTHAGRLDDAVTRALRSAPELAPFFADDRDERFFVKNLERVQGDERDAIILSIGYGKTPHGRVLHRFGPLNNEGGERRLNVAITRARSRMTVVSALRAADLDPTRLKACGALMLRDFLAYAEAGGGRGDEGTLFANAPTTADPLRSDLAARLRREGMTVHEDFGTARHRIDLVVEDPYHRGRGLLAVETDGGRYAALHSTRDRDRLRPEQLARLGWLHERVWTTDLFRDPAREIARIVTTVRAIEPATVHGRDPASSLPDPARDAADGDHADDGPDGTPAADGVDPGTDRTGSAADSTADSTAHSTARAAAVPDDTDGGRRKRRRRVFRKGTGAAADPTSEAGRSGVAGHSEPGARLGRSSDELDLGWGEGSGGSGLGDRWLQEQRPPHYE
ncbi:MAG: AAA domain-containing protein, partial [Humibacillus sp.]